MLRFLLLAVCLLISGCAALGPLLLKALTGASYVDSALDVGRAGADAWLARHPSREVADKLTDLEQKARTALMVYRALLAAGGAVNEGDLSKLRDVLVETYGAYRKAEDEAGILAGRPAIGGAETDAPTPKPVALPTADELAAAL